MVSSELVRTHAGRPAGNEQPDRSALKDKGARAALTGIQRSTKPALS